MEDELVVSSGAAPAPVRRKAVTPTRAKHTAKTVEQPVRANLAGNPEPSSKTNMPEADAIARLAYSYWEARGYQGGSPEEDWLRAEQELLAAV